MSNRLNEIRQRVAEFFDALEDRAAKLPEYRNRAKRFGEALEHQEEVSRQIADLQRQCEPLERELAGIKPAYLDALYEQNESLQAELQGRKRAIEDRLEKLDRAIENKRKSLEPIDGVGLAQLRAEMDSYGSSLPDVFALMEALDIPLHREMNGLESEVSDIGRTLPSGMDADRYSAARMTLDDTYRAQQEAEERRDIVHRAQAEKRGARYQAVLRSNAREAEIAGARADDRISATVADSRLSDEVDE